MKKIKLGFVGAGFNGQIGHLESFSKIKNCKFIALAEDRDKLRSLIKKKNINLKKHIKLIMNFQKKKKNLMVLLLSQKDL